MPDLVNQTRVTNDVRNLSPHLQTSSIESVLQSYQFIHPKIFDLFVHGNAYTVLLVDVISTSKRYNVVVHLCATLQYLTFYFSHMLTVLHFNENKHKGYYVDDEGEPILRVR